MISRALALAPFGALGFGRLARLARNHLLARCDQIRFDPAVSGRTLGREVRHAIGVRHVTMRRAHGDRELRVAGVVDRQRQPRRRGAVLWLVTMPNPELPAATTTTTPDRTRRSTSTQSGTLTAREPLRLEVVADAQVHAVHEQPSSVAVETLDVLQRGDDASDGSHAVVAGAVEHLQAEQLALGRHAGNRRQRRRSPPLPPARRCGRDSAWWRRSALLASGRASSSTSN